MNWSTVIVALILASMFGAVKAFLILVGVAAVASVIVAIFDKPSEITK